MGASRCDSTSRRAAAAGNGGAPCLLEDGAPCGLRDDVHSAARPTQHPRLEDGARVRTDVMGLPDHTIVGNGIAVNVEFASWLAARRLAS